MRMEETKVQIGTAAESLDPLSADCTSDRQYFAPGRVNLIGEHTDYTGGLVLPMAIPFQSTASIAPNCHSEYEFTSDHFSTRCRLHPNEEVNAIGDWSDYCVGVLQQLRNRGIEIAPFRLHIGGNVPIAAGLSSSASIEVATLMALLAHAKATMTVEEMAILCRRAENEFVGRSLRIGPKAVVSVLERDPRCMMITLDPDTGEKEPAILKKVAQAHDGMAGVYGAVLVEGTLHKGDPVEVLE